ncbi:MAG: AIR synthase-related protein [Gammaproteobacteria bacterium]
MLQPIESSKIMLSADCCLCVGFGMGSIQADAVGVVLGLRLGSFDYLKKNNDFEVIVARLASSINRQGIPTIAADVCFDAKYDQASSVSVFTLSICLEGEDVSKREIPHCVRDDKHAHPAVSADILWHPLADEKSISHSYFLEYFDKQVQGRMLLEAGVADASVLQFDDANLLAVSLKQLILTKHENIEQAIHCLQKQVTQSVVAVGAAPLGIVYHLSSRTPEKYQAYLQALNVPIIASFIDGTDDALTIVSLGQLCRATDVTTRDFKRAETTIILIDISHSLLPKQLILSAHVVGDAGVLMALTEMCFKNMLGVNVTIPPEKLLSEVGSLILEVANDKLKDIRQLFADHQLTFLQLGRTTKTPLIQINKEIQLSLQAVKESWQQGLQARVI